MLWNHFSLSRISYGYAAVSIVWCFYGLHCFTRVGYEGNVDGVWASSRSAKTLQSLLHIYELSAQLRLRAATQLLCNIGEGRVVRLGSTCHRFVTTKLL